MKNAKKMNIIKIMINFETIDFYNDGEDIVVYQKVRLLKDFKYFTKIK